MNCLLCGSPINSAGFCTVCGQYQLAKQSDLVYRIPKRSKPMDNFGKFLACIDSKLEELDKEITRLQIQKDQLTSLRINADTYRTLGDEEECPNWP